MTGKTDDWTPEDVTKWDRLGSLTERLDRDDLDIAQKRATVEEMRAIAATASDAALSEYVDTIAQQVEREYIERMLGEIAQLAERATNETLPQRDRNLAQHGIKKRAKEIEACDPDLLEEMGINLEWLAVYREENNAQRRVDRVDLDGATDEWPMLQSEDGTTEPVEVEGGSDITLTHGTPLQWDHDSEATFERITHYWRIGLLTPVECVAWVADHADLFRALSSLPAPDNERTHKARLWGSFQRVRAFINLAGTRDFPPIRDVRGKRDLKHIAKRASEKVEEYNRRKR